MPPRVVLLLVCLVDLAPLFQIVSKIARTTRTIVTIKNHRLIFQLLRVYDGPATYAVADCPQIRGPPYPISELTNHSTRA